MNQWIIDNMIFGISFLVGFCLVWRFESCRVSRFLRIFNPFLR